MNPPIIVAEEGARSVAEQVVARLECGVAIHGQLASSPEVTLDFDRPEDAIAIVLHTSGTTGVPKPVEIAQRRLAL